MQQKTLYRSLVMKLEDVTQPNGEIAVAVHRSASAHRGAERVVVLVLQVVKEMSKVDQIIPGPYGVDVSVATQRLQVVAVNWIFFDI